MIPTEHQNQMTGVARRYITAHTGRDQWPLELNEAGFKYKIGHTSRPWEDFVRVTWSEVAEWLVRDSSADTWRLVLWLVSHV